MQKALNWLRLSIKHVLKNRMLYLTLAVMILLCLMIMGTDTGDDNVVIVGLVSEDDSEFSDAVITSFVSGEYECKIYDDRDALVKDIIRGATDHGFVIKKGAGKAAASGDTKGAVEFISGPSALFGEAVKESFCEVWLRIESDHIIRAQAKELFDGDTDEIVSELIARRDEYLAGDLLFDVDMIGGESDASGAGEASDARGFTWSGTDGRKKGLLYTDLVIGICLFISVFVMYGRTYGGETGSVVKALNIHDRRIYLVMYMISTALPVLIVGTVLSFTCAGHDDILMTLLRMIALTAYSVIWTYIIGHIIRKEEHYIALIPVVTGVQVLIGFLCINMKDYLPVLRWVKWIFPSGVMM